MTKDIILTISGLHDTDGDGDGPIETMCPAQYYMKNGKHYIIEAPGRGKKILERQYTFTDRITTIRRLI